MERYGPVVIPNEIMLKVASVLIEGLTRVSCVYRSVHNWQWRRSRWLSIVQSGYGIREIRFCFALDEIKL